MTTPALLMAGLAACALGIHLGRATANLQMTGSRASGIVVSLELQRRSDPATYRPVVEFSPDGGQGAVQFMDPVGSNPAAYHAGERVRVLYREASPRNSAIIDRGPWNWAGPTAVFLFGALLGVLGWEGRLFRRI